MNILVIASLLLVGCATLANTPAQDRTWAAIEKCRGLQPNGYQVSHVERDGRYFYTFDTRSDGYNQWHTCIIEQRNTP
jgi:hypothetical protein